MRLRMVASIADSFHRSGVAENTGTATKIPITRPLSSLLSV
jgi:hypothetical protein